MYLYLECLDELEDIVVDLFSQVKNKEIELPVWPQHPFNEQHFQTKWYIVPIKHIRSLNIVFPLPDQQKYYKSAVTIISTFQFIAMIVLNYLIMFAFCFSLSAVILCHAFVRARRKRILIVRFESKGMVQFTCVGQTTRRQGFYFF